MRVRRDAFGGCFLLFLLKRDADAVPNRADAGSHWLAEALHGSLPSSLFEPSRSPKFEVILTSLHPIGGRCR